MAEEPIKAGTAFADFPRTGSAPPAVTPSPISARWNPILSAPCGRSVTEYTITVLPFFLIRVFILCNDGAGHPDGHRARVIPVAIAIKKRQILSGIRGFAGILISVCSCIDNERDFSLNRMPVEPIRECCMGKTGIQ